jgi:endonuclease YncB( thermonuclease family)
MYIKRKFFVIALLFTLCKVQAQEFYDVEENGIKSSYDVNIKNLLLVKVLKVMDAQTIFVEYETGKGKVARDIVKLMGIDAVDNSVEERGNSRRRGNNERVETASDRLTRDALEERNVYLAFDRIRNDREGNMLVYVYFSDGGCYNAMMIRQGYARVSIWYPFTFEKEFLKFENDAKVKRYGIWR